MRPDAWHLVRAARRARRGVTLATLAVGLFALCGCTQQRKYQPPMDPNRMTDVQFLHYLETVPVVTFDEGCRAMLIAADGADPFKSHDERYAELKRRGMVRDAWRLHADSIFDLGTACYMAAQALDLKPSACSVLLGSWGLGDRRYAVRQAVDAKLVAYGPYYKPMTGGATVWAMGRMNDFVTQQGVYAGELRAADSHSPAALAAP